MIDLHRGAGLVRLIDSNGLIKLVQNLHKCLIAPAGAAVLILVSTRAARV